MHFEAACTIDNRHMLIMEYVNGGNLADLLDEHKAGLAFDQAIRLAGDILNGLFYLHGQGWIHRDLKPDNILVWNDGRHLHAKITGACHHTHTHTPPMPTQLILPYASRIISYQISVALFIGIETIKRLSVAPMSVSDSISLLRPIEMFRCSVCLCCLFVCFDLFVSACLFRYLVVTLVMAPEVLSSNTYGQAVDMYSFALTFLATLLGLQDPFFHLPKQIGTW